MKSGKLQEYRIEEFRHLNNQHPDDFKFHMIFKKAIIIPNQRIWN